MSSEFFVLTIGKKVSLLQSLSVNYSRTVQQVYSVGDPTIYFVHGHAQGQMNVSRLVSKEGVLKAFKTTDCGKISTLSVSVEGNGSCSVSGSGSVHFDGALLVSVGFSATAGQLQVSEEASIQFGSLMA